MKTFFNYELTRSSFKEAIEIQENKMHQANRKWILEAFNKYPGAEAVNRWCKPLINSDNQFTEKDFFK